MNRECKSV